MALPDLIGVELQEALKELFCQNFREIELKFTSPHQKHVPEGRLRVIRVSGDPQAKVALTVAFENYLKGGVEDVFQNH